MKKIINFIVLPVICMILGASLAGVYIVTSPIISDLEVKTANEARTEVLNQADDFEVVNIKLDDSLGIQEIHKAKNGVGYAIKTQVSGYGGAITIMVGIDKDYNVTGAKILTHGETPGLGAKTAESEFLDQYIGKTEQIVAKKGEATQDNEISTVASATISSKAVTLAINNSIKAAKEAK